MRNGANVALEELFDYSRFSSTLALLSLFVYAPIGIVLFVIRIFIGLHVFLITIVLPKHSYLRSLILRALTGVMGMTYTQEGTHHIHPLCKVLVVNYTTSLDHAVLHLALPHQLVSVWDYSGVVEWLLGCVDLGARAGKDVLVANAKKHLCGDSRLPLLTFPESETTNARVGLLKFSSWPFLLGHPIQPVTIQISRPLFPVSPSLLNSFLITDLFWMLFLPITVFHISYLPVEESSGDALEDSRRTQERMAEHLGLLATAFNSRDKLELIKKRNFEGRHSIGGQGRENERAGPQMAVSQEGAFSDGSKPAKVDVTPPNTSSNQKPVFERNSYDRHLSFQEKKALMIEAARKRYVERPSQ